MRNDKIEAFNLRKEGKSYREITDILGISKSTLSSWFKNVEWSKHQTRRLSVPNSSPEHIQLMQQSRKKKLIERYTYVDDQAKKDYELFKQEPLFWAGLMAYAGVGDKKARHFVRITTGEFYIHKVFMLFAQKYLEIKRDSIKCGLILDPEHNQTLCLEMWSNILTVPRTSFYKTQILGSRGFRKRLQYGVGMSIISSTVSKRKMLVWLGIAQDERFGNAVMV